MKQLDLPPDIRERALVLVAADSVAGNHLQAFLQLNQSDAGLSSFAKGHLISEAAGKSASCADRTQLFNPDVPDIPPFPAF